jgi:hypothetical protein
MKRSTESVEGSRVAPLGGDGAGGVGGLPAPRPAVGGWDGWQMKGLSSLHIGPRVENGCTWGPGGVDAISEAAAEYSQSPWRALPASMFRKLQRDRDVHQLEIAVNGNYMRYKAGCGVAPACAGRRGVVESFSSAARLRMLKFFNSIDRVALPALCIWFLTLTYPSNWPADPRAWKAQLKAFRKRLERAWGPMGIVWKLEPQERGAPHFHLIVRVHPEMSCGLTRIGERFYNGRRQTIWTGGKLSEFRQWVSRAWYEVVGSGDDRHLKAGTSVEPLESWGGVVSYAAKYIGKEAAFIDRETGECLAVGRLWGIWRRELWPVRMERRTLGRDEWVVIRRWVRRYLEKRGRCLRGGKGRPPAFQWIGYPRSCSAFISFDVFNRMVNQVCWFGRNYGRLYDQRRRLWKSMELAQELKCHT